MLCIIATSYFWRAQSLLHLISQAVTKKGLFYEGTKQTWRKQSDLCKSNSQAEWNECEIINQESFFLNLALTYCVTCWIGKFFKSLLNANLCVWCLGPRAKNKIEKTKKKRPPLGILNLAHRDHSIDTDIATHRKKVKWEPGGRNPEPTQGSQGKVGIQFARHKSAGQPG